MLNCISNAEEIVLSVKQLYVAFDMVLKTMKKLHKPYLAVVEALISSVTVILL
jgi:hypothetical protein